MYKRPVNYLDGHQYAALIRFASMLLDGSAAGEDEQEGRVARAHRIVRSAARRRAKRGGSDPYGVARRRVLQHILRREQRPLAGRLNPFVRVVPGETVPEFTMLRQAVTNLSAAKRAVYLLVVLEGLDPGRARAEIADVAVGRWVRPILGPGGRSPDATTVIDGIARETGLSGQRQHGLLAGADPTVVRIRQRSGRPRYVPRPSRGRVISAVAVAVVVLVPVGLFVYPGGAARRREALGRAGDSHAAGVGAR